MRITSLWIEGLAPFPQGKLLRWDMDESRVLFYGVSGSGKTTAFRAAAWLWAALGAFLRGESPAAPPERGGAAMLLSLENQASFLVAAGEEAFLERARAQCPGLGGLALAKKGPLPWGRKPAGFSNLCLADGDWRAERRPSSFRNAWFLTDDDLLKAWPEVLGEALFKKDPQALKVQAAISALLNGKRLEAGAKGLRAVLSGGESHPPLMFSTGEKRVCLLCVMAGLCLKPGGVLMLDEPDVHLHPAQVLGLLSTLENLVLDRDGQILLISHRQEVWRRYEALGLALEMEGGL